MSIKKITNDTANKIYELSEDYTFKYSKSVYRKKSLTISCPYGITGQVSLNDIYEDIMKNKTDTYSFYSGDIKICSFSSGEFDIEFSISEKNFKNDITLVESIDIIGGDNV